MKPQNDSSRAALRVIGPIIMLVGVVVVIFGVQEMQKASERRDKQSREFMAGKRDIHDIDHGPPAGFFILGGGALTIMLGLGLLIFSFQRALLRYQMRQYAPVLREALQEIAPNLAGGTPQQCGNCGTDCPPDARFCKQCGSSLVLTTCSACGASNEPDSRFCGSCGKPL